MNENDHTPLNISSSAGDKYAGLIKKKADEFEEKYKDWFENKNKTDGTSKTVHDHYFSAWNGKVVSLRILRDSDMPEEMKDELFTDLESVEIDDLINDRRSAETD